MENKLRRRFICTAMAAFLAVELLLLIAVNLWNYIILTREHDATADALMELDRRLLSYLPAENFWFSAPDMFRGEKRFTTRFFIVHADRRGGVESVYREFINTVSYDEAGRYMEAALKRGRARGYIGGYRYVLERDSGGSAAVFLSAGRELASMRSLLAVSGAVTIAAGVLALIFVSLLSKRAVAPYVRNLEAQKRFITDASHELKTPLTAIAASAEVLSMEQDGEWVRTIKSETARLTKLVGSLVTLSRLDEEKPALERAEVDLSELAWEIAEPASARARAKRIELSSDIADGVTVTGDAAAIGQLMNVLLDNAVRYTPEGGAISFKIGKSGRKTEISVTNTVGDMDWTSLPRLFDRFYRPDGSRSTSSGGFGVGLSIAKATVEAHGGSIRAERAGENEIRFIALI